MKNTRFSYLRPALLGVAATVIAMSISSTLANHSDSSKYFVYLGTYGEGVHALRFNSNAATFDSIGLVGKVINPSFLAVSPDRRHLYAVSELEGDTTGAVASFAIDPKTGNLNFLNSLSSGGVAPCHLAVDRTGKMLVVANYTSGGVSAFPLKPDGSLGAMSVLMTAQGSSINKERQDGPHAHETVIDAANRRLYVPDLGLDQIRIYTLDPGSAGLAPSNPPFAKQTPGFGPRHMAFTSNGKFAYVMNELKPEVTVFSHDTSNGSLQQLSNVPTLPADFSQPNTGAEIVLDPSGRYLYTSNRGADTIQVFDVDSASGGLKQIQTISSGGKTPRGFAVDPAGNFLVAGNQDSNNVVIFRIEKNSGKLVTTGQQFTVPKPVDVLFVPAE